MDHLPHTPPHIPAHTSFCLLLAYSYSQANPGLGGHPFRHCSRFYLPTCIPVFHIYEYVILFVLVMPILVYQAVKLCSLLLLSIKYTVLRVIFRVLPARNDSTHVNERDMHFDPPHTTHACRNHLVIPRMCEHEHE